MKSMPFVFLVLASLAAMPAASTAKSIVINGSGITTIAPNIAYVIVEVASRDADPRRAQAKNVEATRSVLAELEKAGIPKDDFGSSQYSFQSDRYDYERKEGPRYQANTALKFKVTRFDILGQAIAAALAGGATDIRAVVYAYDKPEELVEKARTDAFANARNEAERSAKAAGLQLGDIIQIGNGRATLPEDQMQWIGVAFSLKRSTPSLEPQILPGVVTIGYEVTVEYELK